MLERAILDYGRLEIARKWEKIRMNILIYLCG
jgi:hypothetical protein